MVCSSSFCVLCNRNVAQFCRLGMHGACWHAFSVTILTIDAVPARKNRFLAVFAVIVRTLKIGYVDAMFGKIFGKLSGADAKRDADVAATIPAAPTKPIPPPKPVVDVAAWQQKIQAAGNDGAALLKLATDAPQVELKLAAISAIADEAMLKQTEKAFRDHDRRVHKLAKDKYQQVVHVRETRDAAANALAVAHELAQLPAIPANRLVELDRAWAALNADLCLTETVTSYNSLRAQLTEITRYRVENELAQNRWLVQANANTFALMTALKAVVASGDAISPEIDAAAASLATESGDVIQPPAPRLAARYDQALAVLADAPANLSDKTKAVHGALQVLVADADAVRAKLHFLSELEAEKVLVMVPTIAPTTAPASPPPVAIEAAQVVSEGASVASDVPVDALNTGASSHVEVVESALLVAAVALVAPVVSPKDQWRRLATVQNEALSQALELRFQAWQQSQLDKRRDSVAKVKQGKKDVTQKARQTELDALSAQINDANAQLTAGHIGHADKLVAKILNSQKHMHLDGGFQAKIENLVADHARLKGWQRWSGGLRREDLVAEADALNVASREPKLQSMEHAAEIDKLRERWKELDKLGAAGSQPLWDKFDAALRSAYLPVDAHLQKLKQARQENLSQRRIVIAHLNKFSLVLTPAVSDGGAVSELKTRETQTQQTKAPETKSQAAKAPDWREVARALDAAQVEWRKCGPVEHTVARSAQQNILQDWNKAQARLEEPLAAVRKIEKTKREKLIAKAHSLVGANSKIDDVRNLQSQWQTLAKALPLSRNEENALWNSFKSATDLVFSKRQEAFDAKQAQFQVNAAAREALIAQLEALNDETPAPMLKRALVDVDTNWKRAGEAPRAASAKLDAQYAKAREIAQQRLSSFATRAWQTTCDSLQAKLALCREVEAGANRDEKAAAFAGIQALPLLWEASLLKRFNAANSTLKKPDNRVSAAIDETLLRLEMALDMNAPDAQQVDTMVARRELKMRDMKAALETRTATAPMDANTRIITLIAQALADGAQVATATTATAATPSARLDAVLRALRQRPCEFAGKQRG